MHSKTANRIHTDGKKPPPVMRGEYYVDRRLSGFAEDNDGRS